MAFSSFSVELLQVVLGLSHCLQDYLQVNVEENYLDLDYMYKISVTCMYTVSVVGAVFIIEYWLQSYMLVKLTESKSFFLIV